MLEKEVNTFQPQEFNKYGLNKNLASRFFEILPKVFGKKGEIFVGGYQYLCWVDDVIDENRSVSLEEKASFLNRQIDLVRGKTPNNLNEFEERFNGLPWNLVDEKEIKKQVEIILYGIQDDLTNMPLVGRSSSQIRHTEWRTAIPTLRIASLVINGSDLKITNSLAKLAEFWSAKDDVNHFYEDLDDDLVKLPMEFNDREKLNSLMPEEKKDFILKLFPKEKLVDIQWQNLAGMLHYFPYTYKNNLKNYQKFIFSSYLLYRLVNSSVKNWIKSKDLSGSNVPPGAGKRSLAHPSFFP